MNPNQTPRRRSIANVALLTALVASTLWAVQTATATPPAGLTATPLAAGNLAEPVRLKFKADEPGFGAGIDVSRIVTVKYTLDPGGSFGWHQHGGPVWAVVASGTLTLYHADDPACKAHPYAAGSSFLDPGDHTHIARNEGAQAVEVYATFMLPEGGQLRVDTPDPGNCSF